MTSTDPMGNRLAREVNITRMRLIWKALSNFVRGTPLYPMIYIYNNNILLAYTYLTVLLITDTFFLKPKIAKQNTLLSDA